MSKYDLIKAYLKHTGHWIADVEDAEVDRIIHGAGWHEIRFKYTDGHYTVDVTIDELDLLAFVWASAKTLEK